MAVSLTPGYCVAFLAAPLGNALAAERHIASLTPRVHVTERWGFRPDAVGISGVCKMPRRFRCMAVRRTLVCRTNLIIAVNAIQRPGRCRSIDDVDDGIPHEWLERLAVTGRDSLGDFSPLLFGEILVSRGVNHICYQPALRCYQHSLRRQKTPPRQRAGSGVWRRTCLGAGYFVTR
jgi:hypothetical protein